MEKEFTNMLKIKPPTNTKVISRTTCMRDSANYYSKTGQNIKEILKIAYLMGMDNIQQINLCTVATSSKEEFKAREP